MMVKVNGLEKGGGASQAHVPSLEGAFEENFDAIYRYAYRRANPAVAEEIAAETFARAVGRWHSFDPSLGSPRVWLFGIAANVVREHARAVRNAAPHRLVRLEAEDDPIERLIDRLGDTERVASALAQLRPDAQDVLLLVGGLEFGYDDAARVLGIPTGTVRSRLSAARSKLTRELARMDAVESNRGRTSS